MSGREAKFCLDRDKVRWVLLEGVINRKTDQDDPTGGENLPFTQLTGVEKTSVTRVRRSPLAWPAIYAGVAMLALFAWIATANWWLALPGILLGVVVLFWGLRRVSGQKEVLDAYQLLAPGTRPEDWLVIGSHLEVLGFVEGVRQEVEANRRAQAAAGN